MSDEGKNKCSQTFESKRVARGWILADRECRSCVRWINLIVIFEHIMLVFFLNKKQQQQQQLFQMLPFKDSATNLDPMDEEVFGQ